MRLLPYACLLGILTSCTTLKEIGQPATEPINEENYKNLEGRYKCKGEYEFPVLWNMVAPYNRSTRKGQLAGSARWDSLYVSVRVSPKTMTFQLRDRGGLINSKEIKGKIKDGYFYGRQHILICPLPIFLAYDFYRYRIGINGDFLVVDERKNSFMLFFIIQGSNHTWKGRRMFPKVK